MTTENDSRLEEILNSENAHIRKLHELVEKAVEEEQLLTAKLYSVEADPTVTLGQRMADGLASFGGSWTFILVFLALMVIWISSNVWFLAQPTFDPYPFILLNLLLSCLAALQAPVIMMSQNRQEEKDRTRARNDFMVNLKAEMEVRSLHDKMDLLIADQMQTLFELQKSQLELLKRIEDHIFNKK